MRKSRKKKATTEKNQSINMFYSCHPTQEAPEDVINQMLKQTNNGDVRSGNVIQCRRKQSVAKVPVKLGLGSGRGKNVSVLDWTRREIPKKSR